MKKLFITLIMLTVSLVSMGQNECVVNMEKSGKLGSVVNKKEIPNIKRVYEKYAGENFDVLSVAVWDDPQASVDTAAAYGVNWAEIVNAQKIPSDLYGIEGIPHIILFGPDGTILKRDLRGSSIEKEVAACLGR